MSRRHPCDLCGHERRPWQRLCAICWAQLPGDLRTAITDGWRRGAKAEWRRAKKAALEFIGTRVSRHMRSITAAEAYQQTAARLGERDA